MNKLNDFIKENKILCISAVISVLIFTVIVCAAISATSSKTKKVAGKSLSEYETSMSDSVTALFTAIQSGDAESAYTYCSDDAAVSLSISSTDSAAFRTELLSEIGIAEETLYEPASEALDTLLSDTASRFVETIDYSKPYNVKEKKRCVSGNIDIKIDGIAGYNTLNFSDAVTAANEDLVAYINGDMENLMNNLDTSGRDNLKTALINHSLIKLFSDVDATVGDIPSSHREYTLLLYTVKEKDGSLKTIVKRATVHD